MTLPRKLQELCEGMEENRRITLEHEREHHPQIREIVRKLGRR